MKLKTSKPAAWLHWGLSFLLSFLTCVFLLTDRRAEVLSVQTMILAMNGTNPGTFCLLSFFVWFYFQLPSVKPNRKFTFACLGGFLFTLCSNIGFQIYHFDSIFPVPCNFYALFLAGMCIAGGFFLYTGLLLILFCFLENHCCKSSPGTKLDRLLGCGPRSFFLSFGILMLISIPLQIFFYPGITNPDSFVQISESMGLSPLTDRHPFLHTLMMKLMIGIGRNLFGSIAAGVCFYTFFQSVMAALTVSYVLTYMAKMGIHPYWRLASLVFYGLHPAIACYNITLWKDVWLSYFILLYVLFLIDITLHPRNFFQKKAKIIFFALVILGCLFTKNTGILIFAGTLPFLYVICKENRRKLTGLTLLIFLLLGLVRLVLIPQLGIVKGQPTEPFSVPLQQLARTSVYEENSLTEEQKQIIGEIMPYDQLPELYEPHISDPVKNSVASYVLLNDPVRYLKCWLEIGFSHPRAYLESFLANSCGYWYPGVVYWMVDSTWYFQSPLLMDPGPRQDPDAENYTINPDKIVQRHYFVHLFSMLQEFPGASTFLSAAFPFWSSFVLFLICMVKKKYKMLLPLLVPLLVWVVCIFSPVIAEYRYAFPAVVCLPLLTAFSLQDSCTN